MPQDSQHPHVQRAERDQHEEDERTLAFAIIPKKYCVGTSPFFLAVLQGCQQRAEQLGNARCECIEASDFPPDTPQEDIISNVTARGTYDGIAISVRGAGDEVVGAISDAVDAGIPVVTFDSDSPRSRRSAYIGTDNLALGRQLGKVLNQLRPTGGTYAIVSGKSNNILERERGVRDALAGTRWAEIGDGLSPLDGTGNETTAVERMWGLAESRPDLDAFVPVFGAPMRGKQWKEFATKYQSRIAVVSADWGDNQMDMLSQGHADGLVGQIPHEMGVESAKALHQLQDTPSNRKSEILYGTNLIEILRVPLVLPPLEVDYNYLGNLTILGYIFFAVVALLSIGCAIWTYINRHTRVVKASQPMFLILISVGVLIFASTIIPLGIDDEHNSQRRCDIACMCQPWLFSTGFSLIFAVLFSKTWRINRLFHNPNKFRRIRVTQKDVILPLILLVALNGTVLACWTAVNPLQYSREFGTGTDLWNRPTSSTGSCKGSAGGDGGVHDAIYLILIGIINLGALVMANVQAYIARDIQTEYSESKYIALVLASILQVAVIGIPTWVLSRDSPKVNYILPTVIIFVLSVAIILLIFLPKYMQHTVWLARKKEKQRIKERRDDFIVNDDTRGCRPHDDGSSGLKVMLKQSILIKPGVTVSVQGTAEEAQRLQSILEKAVTEEEHLQQAAELDHPEGEDTDEGQAEV